jgi:hypothetical protein
LEISTRLLWLLPLILPVIGGGEVGLKQMKGRERGNPIPVKPLVTSLFILFIDFFVESNMENVMSLNIMVACKKIIYTEVDQFLPFPVCISTCGRRYCSTV